MRFFIVLCLVAATYADKLGYNYRPVGHADAGLSFQPVGFSQASHSALGSALGSAYDGDFNNGVQHGGAISGIGLGLSSISSEPVPAAAASVAPAAPVNKYTKEFFSFSAPEQEFDDVENVQQNIESNLQKHLRVIFIKGPENRALENAALSLAKHSSEQKTTIYVLNKQPDVANLASKLNSESSHNNAKPEVHFIKYRAQEDAANALQSIQSQYNALSGPTHSFSGEVAPVLNFASKTAAPASEPAPVAPIAPVQGPAEISLTQDSSAPAESSQAPASTYLPSSFIRLK